jgi:hypothetical protein
MKWRSLVRVPLPPLVRICKKNKEEEEEEEERKIN